MTIIEPRIDAQPTATPGLRKLYYAAHTYMILGLVSGLAYREITKIKHFTGDTQLGLLHTHLLALGMLFFLIVIVLEELFTLTASKLFSWFFWTYNAGLALTVTMMAIHGTQTVFGAKTSNAIAGTAGLGHTILTLGLIFFFILLGKRLSRAVAARSGREDTTAWLDEQAEGKEEEAEEEAVRTSGARLT